jgi:uncharacterized protein (TIGR02145 family)
LWNDPNTAADNSSGFTGLPGGDRFNFGTFTSIGYSGSWWSSTEYSSTIAWSRYLYYSNGFSARNDNFKTPGFSVRCLRD